VGQAEVPDDDGSGFAMDFMQLRPPTGSDFLTTKMANTERAGCTEADSKGKNRR